MTAVILCQPVDLRQSASRLEKRCLREDRARENHDHVEVLMARVPKAVNDSGRDEQCHSIANGDVLVAKFGNPGS